MALGLAARPGFSRDCDDVDVAVVKRAVALLVEVSNGTLAGLELEKRASTADLSDCRKIYFDVDDRKPRYRLVYRLLPNEVAPVTVQAVAVGLRDGLDAYVRAAANLGR